jgi:SAM-dependent methyltransferase
MDQANPDFNDAIETYFPIPLVPGAVGRVVAWLDRGYKRILGGRRLVNERIVEYPVVLRWIRESGRVLDVGCVSSRLPLHLAALGYEVCGVDLRAYPLAHPRFAFHRLDLLGPLPPVEPESFDVVTAVSCIEHFGLGAYGEGAGEPAADRRAVEVMRRLLRPGGQLLCSLPYGRRGVTAKHRVYDRPSLEALLEGFTVSRAAYFRRADGGWSPATREELADVPSPDLPVNGVAIVDASRV